MATQNIYSINSSVPCPPLKEGEQILTPAMLSAYIRRSIEQIKYLLETDDRNKALSQLDLIRQEIAFLTNTRFERVQDVVQTVPNSELQQNPTS
jgi:hypothetical protein